MKRAIGSLTAALAAVALLSGCGPASTSAASADSAARVSLRLRNGLSLDHMPAREAVDRIITATASLSLEL